MRQQFLLTCEHASNAIPDDYQELFSSYKSQLITHRGWDIGALGVFNQLVAQLNCPQLQGQWSRLLVDLNRSAAHKQVFSEVTRKLSKMKQQALLEQYYWPYHQSVRNAIDRLLQQNHQVIHLSVHSFCPELNGAVRNNDIGLLYDPSRFDEMSLCQNWQARFKKHTPYLVRMNYPYRGTSNGLTTLLRREYQPEQYIGIELELNQRHFSAAGDCLSRFDREIVSVLTDGD